MVPIQAGSGRSLNYRIQNPGVYQVFGSGYKKLAVQCTYAEHVGSLLLVIGVLVRVPFHCKLPVALLNILCWCRQLLINIWCQRTQDVKSLTRIILSTKKPWDHWKQERVRIGEQVLTQSTSTGEHLKIRTTSPLICSYIIGVTHSEYFRYPMIYAHRRGTNLREMHKEELRFPIASADLCLPWSKYVRYTGPEHRFTRYIRILCRQK